MLPRTTPQSRSPSDTAPTTPAWMRWLGRGAGAWLVVAGLVFLVTGVIAVINFAWPQPTYDQFRLYPLYLELPFPDNILQRENGHRPIVPGLVRVAEIHWFAANQFLQIALGLLAAVLTSACCAWTCARDATLMWPARCAGFGAAFVAIFWLGNARMLLHGNELVHAYLLTLCVVLGAGAVWRASMQRPMAWMGAACIAATVATFCFGPGMACFPAFAIAALAVRVPLRAVLLPFVVLALCLVLYIAVLPGDDSVRDSLALRPLENLVAAARWIASPWINGWLGFAEPPLDASSAQILRAASPWLVDSANFVHATTHLPWATWQAGLIGAAGFAVLGAWLARALWRRDLTSKAELLGGVLMLFGAASALIIAIGRLDYFALHPAQIFADRYLIWPCLFWFGVLLTLLVQRGGIGRVTRPLAIGVAMIATVWLWPTHTLGVGWGSEVYRLNQKMAAAARADVIDAEVFWKDDPSVAFDEKLRSLKLFRERRLAMFRQPGATSLGETWTGTLDAAPGDAVWFGPVSPTHDVREGHAGATFQGVHLDDIERAGLLVVLDDSDRIVGFGEPSYVGDEAPALRWSVPRKRGFDVFIHAFDAAQTYRLAQLDFDAQRGVLLGALPR